MNFHTHFSHAKWLIVAFFLFLSSGNIFVTSLYAQDTLKTHTLPGVRVSAQRPSETTAEAPLQVAPIEKMAERGVTQLYEAIEQFSGVTIKDYGGVGGIKTISARGLGSQFSSLTIDGIDVNDCQNGQVDLGRYSLGSVDYVSFAQGQTNNPLQSARSYAAGNVLNLSSREPLLLNGNTSLTAKIEGGSFGLISPSVLIDQRISTRVKLSVWGDYTHSDGDYPFLLYYSRYGTNDSVSRERRNNSRVDRATLDGNLFLDLGPQREMVVRMHYFQSENQLPGPVTFYNVRGSESTANRVLFTQFRYQNRHLSDRMQLQVLGKYSRNFDSYQDTAINNPAHLLYNEYLQQEGYGSATLVLRAIDQFRCHLFISLSTDEALCSLQSNLVENNQVSRFVSQDVLAVSYRHPGFDMAANILATWADEKTNSNLHHRYQKLSPFVGCNLQIYSRSWTTDSGTFYRNLRMRYFFKENYRLPNFSEMYFFTLTRELKPERALQNNLGLTYRSVLPSPWKTYPSVVHQATIDCYFNRVSDKIVAIPQQNLFLWSMVNLGIVDILGVDATAEVSVGPLSVSANYSFARALDMTDSTSKVYRQQIPYTPRHSGGFSATWRSRYGSLNYSVLCVGNRYSLGQNTANNLVAGYVDQDITYTVQFLVHEGKFKSAVDAQQRGLWTLQAKVLNLFDVQYEVVKSYPMMGRSFRLSLSYHF